MVEDKRPADIPKRRGRTADESFVADLAAQAHCEVHIPSEISSRETMRSRCDELSFFQWPGCHSSSRSSDPVPSSTLPVLSSALPVLSSALPVLSSDLPVSSPTPPVLSSPLATAFLRRCASALFASTVLPLVALVRLRLSFAGHSPANRCIQVSYYLGLHTCHID